MENMKNKERSFLSRCYIICIIPNVLCAWVLLAYSCLIINLDMSENWLFFLIVNLLIYAAQFILCPITNTFFMGKASKLLQESKIRDFSIEERTKLFLLLHKIPNRNRLSCLIYFLSCSVFLFAGFYFVLNVNIYIALANMVSCFFGSYIASLLEFNFSKRICIKYETELVAQGIDQKIVDRKKYFGERYEKTFIEFCINPVVMSTASFILIFVCYYFNNSISENANGFIAATGNFGIVHEQLSKLILIAIINILVCIAAVYSFLARILRSTKHLQGAMNNIISNDIFTVNLTPTDYDNEVSYNIALVNKVVILFRSVLDEIHGIGKTMIEPINKLTEISENTAATSLEQSTGVKEILATMEETDSQTREIAEKISEVTSVAEDTEKNVEIGFSTLQQNLDKMNEITEANISTISGIRELGDKIGSIWDIVKIINDIADQTRIIAFNEELEASSAGESGKNCHIVANEVRRLATGITNSVNQIKERITEIQHSSDGLIITSESGTEKIKEGLELSNILKDKFSEIQQSSEITVESAVQIKEIIYQQSAAFDQIVSTVRQIAAGIENFSTSTNSENETAQKLKKSAENLENLHEIIIS